MTYAVNLMDAQRLLPPRRLPLASVPAAMAVVALVTFGVSWWAGEQSSVLRSQRDLLQADMKRLKTVAGMGGTDRTQMLDALRQQAMAEEAWVQRLEGADDGIVPPAGSALPPRASAAAWLQALGTTAGDGAWLTRVRVDARGQVSADGRATGATALHAHLARWRNDPLLAAVALQSIDVRRAEGDGSELMFSIRPSQSPAAPPAPAGSTAPGTPAIVPVGTAAGAMNAGHAGAAQ